MKKFLRIVIVLLGCLHLAGGPHAMLQGYAWMTMLVTYSIEDGIVQGARDTFSGERPCALCERISTSRETAPEPSPAPLASSAKLLQDIIHPRIIAIRPPRGIDAKTVRFFPPGIDPGHDREAPPVPPPLAVA